MRGVNTWVRGLKKAVKKKVGTVEVSGRRPEVISFH